MFNGPTILMTIPSWRNDFYVEKWHAWVPFEQTDLPKFFKSENIFTQTPDFSFIPAMTRRRLSFLTKISLYVADKCFGLDNTDDVQIVFASQHGELQNSVKLLQSIAKDEDLSPALFSLSVHNAAAGVFTILSKNKSPHCFISAGEETISSAIVEAISSLSNDINSKILLVIADDQVPEIYKNFVPNFKDLFALAMLINRNELGKKFSIEKSNNPNENKMNNAIDFISFLSELSDESEYYFPTSSVKLKKGDMH